MGKILGYWGKGVLEFADLQARSSSTTRRTILGLNWEWGGMERAGREESRVHEIACCVV